MAYAKAHTLSATDSFLKHFDSIVKRRDDVEKAKGLAHKNTQKFRSVIEEECSEIDWKDRLEDFGD